jgi:hypothetical protein
MFSVDDDVKSQGRFSLAFLLGLYVLDVLLIQGVRALKSCDFVGKHPRKGHVRKARGQIWTDADVVAKIL